MLSLFRDSKIFCCEQVDQGGYGVFQGVAYFRLIVTAIWQWRPSLPRFNGFRGFPVFAIRRSAYSTMSAISRAYNDKKIEMKKLALSFLFAASIALLATCAMAGTETYDTKVGEFTILVPDGWKGQAIPAGCAVQTPDGANALTVQLVPAEDMTAMDAANKMAEAAKVKVNSRNDDGNAVFLDCDKDGLPWGILMIVTNDVLIAAQFAGRDRDGMMRIYDTLKRKQP